MIIVYKQTLLNPYEHNRAQGVSDLVIDTTPTRPFMVVVAKLRGKTTLTNSAQSGTAAGRSFFCLLNDHKVFLIFPFSGHCDTNHKIY